MTSGAEERLMETTARSQRGGCEAGTSHILVQPKQKTNEWLSMMDNISLKAFFGLWGKFIGAFPTAFLIAGIIIASLSFGIFKLHLRDNVRDGYTPSTSRSREETNLYREFLGSEGDPTMTTVLMLARDNGSMHRINYLSAAVQQMENIAKNLTATAPDGTTIGYKDFCGHYCDSNQAVPYFLQALYDKTNNPGRDSLRLTFPIASLKGVKLHLERNFFGVTTTSSNNSITNMEHVKIISMNFMAEVKTGADVDRLGAWEMAVFDYCDDYMKHENILELLVIGAEIVDTEMNKDGQRMAPYFATGFMALFAFVILTVFLSSMYYHRLNWYTVIVSLACALLPVLSITSTFGLSSAVGNRTNSLMLIMPFLIMGIGVNDSFLTVHAWLRTSTRKSKAERIGCVLEEVGPSITTTTLTNVVTFMIGWFTPTEEISIFCLGCAMALAFAYIFTVFMLCPILYFCSAEQTDEDEHMGQFNATTKKAINSFLSIYCKLLTYRWVAAGLLFGMLFYWYFGGVGTAQMSAKLDTNKILPKDTPIRRPNQLIEQHVWLEFYPVTVIVNNPIDLRDAENRNQVHQLVKEFEDLPMCKGANFSIVWLRDYEEYFNISWTDYSDEVTDEEEFLGYSKLRGFLGSPFFKHYKAFLNLDYSKSVAVRKFSFLVVYENVSSWGDRIDIMLEWRAIADRYPQLNVSVWNVNSMFTDQMLSLKSLTAQNCFYTLLCMAIVCAIFIQNPFSVLLATLNIASISLGVMGYLSWWHLDLDPVSLAAILISIGQSVDFVAHTTYHFQISTRTKMVNGKEQTIEMNTAYERLRFMYASVAWPQTQAALSTLICVLPLASQENYIPLVFVKTIVLVVIWGLFHGLVFLPCLLAQMPLTWLNFNCYRAILKSQRNEPQWRAMEEIVPLRSAHDEKLHSV